MIVLDACIVISFGNAGHLDIIDELQQDEVCISVRARSEVVRDPARFALESSIASAHISVASIDIANPTEQQALQQYDARPAFRGRGDAEVLALGASRGYVVASDEHAIRSIVIGERGGKHIAGTLDFIVWAVREGRLAIVDAELALSRIDSGSRVLAQSQRGGRTLSDLV